VLRWSPAGEPLQYHGDPQFALPSPAAVPACGACGGPRHFECQLLSTAVFYLTQRLSAKDSMQFGFGSAFVFTCAQHCQPDNANYSEEFVFVQPEM
jgi:pre-rRNA-processing protein TSR4